MGSKLMPGAFDCHAAALPDETMFVLLARDRSAPTMLRAWSDQRRKDTHTAYEAGEISIDQMEEDLRKCSEADACADEMIVWRKRNDGRWRAGSELRSLLGAASDEERALIEAAAVKAVGEACGIPSQFHSGAMTVGAHFHRLWRSPLFSGRRHVLTLATHGRFETLNVDSAQEPDRYSIQGMHVADIEVVDHSSDRLTLELSVVVDG
jgi:hypothetical protein